MYPKNEFGQLVGYPIENWQPLKRPEKSLIKGNYCIIEPIDLDKHAEKLFDVLSIDNQGESWTYLPYGPFATAGEFKDWLMVTMAEEATQLYAILDGKTSAILGIFGYLRINPKHGVIEIGHVHFSTLLKQTPMATEAIYLFLRHAFSTHGYRRCEWKCNHLNEASKRAAERFGFTFEGIFRQSNVFKYQNRDTAWYSIIDSEWPALKDKFEKWLDPGNFSESGKQKIKLSDI